MLQFEVLKALCCAICFVPQMYDVVDIMACNVDKCMDVPSQGCASFLKRAVYKADSIHRKANCITLRS